MLVCKTDLSSSFLVRQFKRHCHSMKVGARKGLGRVGEGEEVEE